MVAAGDLNILNMFKPVMTEAKKEWKPVFCKRCEANGVKTELVFNKNVTRVRKSDGKTVQVPLDKKTKQPHDCPYFNGEGSTGFGTPKTAKPKVWAKINQITPLVKNVNLEAIVIGVEEERAFQRKDASVGTFQRVTIGDDTGEITLTLWDGDVGKVEVGERIKLEKAFVTVFQDKVQLSLGKYGKLSKVGDEPPATEAKKTESDEEDIPTL